MRNMILVLAMCVSACVSAPMEAGRALIEVYRGDALYYSIADGGPARFVSATAAHPLYEFQASREDYAQVAEWLEPLRGRGAPCGNPSENIAPERIIWRLDGEEVSRAEVHIICYGEGARALAARAGEAARLMEALGHASYVAPAIPEPTIITLQNLYWGRPTATWTIPREGMGRYADSQRTVDFPVPAETFGRIREIFRPYEARDFHCERVVADGPYGYVIWSSREGQEDQRTQWDAGCLSGDAGDLFARLDQATEILVALRDALQP